MLLYLLRQRGRDAVWVKGRIIKSLGLQKNLMRLALLELCDLVFDRRAIARARPRNGAGIDRARGEVFLNDPVPLLGGLGNKAIDLRGGDGRGQEGERLGLGVAF